MLHDLSKKLRKDLLVQKVRSMTFTSTFSYVFGIDFTYIMMTHSTSET